MAHEVDPEASISLWELDVELGGWHFTVPALPASEWFPMLLSGDVGRILDMMVSTSRGDPVDPLDLLLEGKLAEGELADRCIDAFEEVAGRPFGVAFTLAYAATQRWATINGRLVLAGFDWETRPLGAALDAIYAVFTENASEEGRTKFDAFLETPINTGPKGKVRKADADRMEAGFAGIAGPKPTTGVARATGAPSDNARSRTRSQPQQLRPASESAAPTRPRGQRARSGPAASS